MRVPAHDLSIVTTLEASTADRAVGLPRLSFLVVLHERLTKRRMQRDTTTPVQISLVNLQLLERREKSNLLAICVVQPMTRARKPSRRSFKGAIDFPSRK